MGIHYLWKGISPLWYKSDALLQQFVRGYSISNPCVMYDVLIIEPFNAAKISAKASLIKLEMDANGCCKRYYVGSQLM